MISKQLERSIGTKRGHAVSKARRQRLKLQNLHTKKDKLTNKRKLILKKFPSHRPASIVIELDSLNLRIQDIEDEINGK